MKTAQFDRSAIDEAKARYNITDIVSRWVAKPLRRTGHEMVGLCLFHQERTPSMRVNDATGTFHCFGCGKGGDVVSVVMDHLKLTFVEALTWLGAAELPPVDPAERSKAIEADRVDRAAHIQDAKRFWREAQRVGPGDPVDVYLRARGITIPAPASIRFGMLPSWQDRETKEWGRRRPCMVGGCQDGTGALVGIQRVFFRNEDPALGKADCKLSLGQVKGAALRLGPTQPTISMTEGPEDGLSILQMCPERAVWVAFGTGLMPFIEYPPEVSEVAILGQNNGAGREAVRKAGEAIAARGMAVRETWPAPDFDDWNDWLRGKRK